MPRPNRVHVEGGVYHVYNRLGRGERVFESNEIAGEFVRLLSDVVSPEELQSRSRDMRLVRARELLVTLGAERYGLSVNDLARAIRKSPQGVTRLLARSSRKRTSDAAFRRDLDGMDKVLAEAVMGQSTSR